MAPASEMPMFAGTGSSLPWMKICRWACSCMRRGASGGRPRAVARAADWSALAGHGASVVRTPGSAADGRADVSFRSVKKNTPAATAIAMPAIHTS